MEYQNGVEKCLKTIEKPLKNNPRWVQKVISKGVPPLLSCHLVGRRRVDSHYLVRNTLETTEEPKVDAFLRVFPDGGFGIAEFFSAPRS